MSKKLRLKHNINVDQFKDYHVFWYNLGIFWTSNIRFLYPKTIFVITMTLLAILSLFNLNALKILIPLVFIYFYQSKTIKDLSQHLKIKRIHTSKGKEEDEIDFEYHFSNPCHFNFYNFNLFDFFSGHENKQKQNYYLITLDYLPKNTKKKVNRRVDLNYGMGEKEIGPMGLFLTDELGIHRLSYQEEHTSPFQVYPKVYRSRPHSISPNPLSRHFGEFDTYQRGENVNFYGVREYQQGDNVKTINWKLSLKSNQLIVNEFEKNVNGKILIIFNNDKRIHSGEGAQSSFEYIKDLTLSICHHHIKNNNEIGLISHGHYTPSNTGPAHIQGMELLMGKIQLAEYNMTQVYHRGASTPEEIIRFKKKIAGHLDQYTHLYFITGFLPGKIFNYYMDALKIWSRRSLKTHLIAVNSIAQQQREASDENEAGTYQHILGKLGPEKQKLESIIKAYNIKASFINVDRHIPYQHIIKEGLKS